MSSATESLAQKWLRQNVQSYAFKDAVYSHVDSALSQFTSIRPKTDVYTYDDGRTQLLLCLHGLLPISYRGASYNIPIAVWITRDYPREPPIAYVVPTNDMLVRASKYVDVSGRCQIEYLQNWQKKSEGCSVIALLEAMKDHFSREPPVYAKPKGADASQRRAQSQPRRAETTGPDYTTRPPPPIVGPTLSSSPLSQSAPIPPPKNGDRPPVPLKPGQHAASSMPPVLSHPNTQSDLRPQSPMVNGSPAAIAMRPPPPLPGSPPIDPILPRYRNSPAPLPPHYAVHDRTPSMGAPANVSSAANAQQWTPNVLSRPMSGEFDHNRGSIPPYSPASQIPHATGPSVTRPPPVPPPVPPPPTGSHYAPVPPPVSPPRTTQQSHPYPPPPHISQTTATPPSTGFTQPGIAHPQPAPHPTMQPLPPAVMRPPPSIPPPDLLDAEDDLSNTLTSPAPAAAPPRPPNPELLRLHDQLHAKLSSELASLTQAMVLDAERLRVQQADLLAGEPAIRDEMARLEAVRDVCNGVAGRMRQVVEDAERNVTELKRRGDPEVDELVCSTTIVHDQLINLVAEDSAIEDTIYHLHRALNAGRIDLERFLRTTRILAEEQFTKRALIEKIIGGIPMGESVLQMRSSEWS